jgi:hypothetical protein
MKTLIRHLQVVFTRALLTMVVFASSEAIAGSGEPNPAALAKAAASMKNASDTTNKEVKLLLTKLGEGGDFTKRFDQAAFKKDKEQLVNLMREAGMKRSDVTIEEIASDLKIKVKCCFRGVCVSISIGW